MRITAQIHCYNSAEYLFYVLKSIYSYVDKIVIIEGAWGRRIKIKRSTDNTLLIINNFADYEKKIKFVQDNLHDEVAQRNIILDHLDYTDWLFVVDDDEIYKYKDLFFLRNFLENANEDGYFIRSYDFINSFQWYRETKHRRLFRVKDNMKFVDINRMSYDNQPYYKVVSEIPNIAKYHYSYIHNKEKARIKELSVSHKYKWKYKDGFFNRAGLKVDKFEGEHPEIMKDHPYSKIKWKKELTFKF